MKAVRIHQYGGPEVLVFEEVPRPEPKPNQVLVKVKAASVNQSDVAVREARFPTPLEPPKTIGSDGAGIVEEVGAEVSGVAPGDEVFFSGLGIGSQGSYAEYVVLFDVQAVPKPPGLSFVEAAALGMVFPAAYYGLVERGGLREGESVMIQGAAGGVGSASVQLAKALGARVIGTVKGAQEAELVKSLGADDVIDYGAEDVAERVAELTGGRGVDLVNELVVSVNLATDIRAVAKRGRIVCTGQGPDPEARVPIGEALGKDVDLRFMNLGNAGRAGTAQIAAKIGELAASGRIRAVVGATLPLSEARRAHELLAGEHIGKIVLETGA